MGMTIPASAIIGGDNKYKLNINGKREGRKAIKEKEELPKTREDILIEQFKEEHSPEKTRVEEIYAKFRAGKELTPDELKYLAENEPEVYKEVMEIIRERKAMEAQMKLAKTKQEVSSVHVNKMTNIKAAMGHGKQAESQAMKTMTRANQMMDAYTKFTSTKEYREKDDERSQALRRREELLRMEELLEERKDKTDEEKEQPEKILKEEEEKRPEKKKRRKYRIEDDYKDIDFVDYELLKQKLDSLYYSINGYGGNKTNTRRGAGGVDLFL